MDYLRTLNSKPSRWSKTRPKRTSLALILGALLFLAGRSPAGAAPWLFVSDIHLKANARHAPPSKLGDDSDQALFDSALREMKRVDPNPPVVVVTGDLLAHWFDKRQAAAVTIRIANEFNRAFPQAQFVLALGNDDGECGDYGLTPNTAFLRDVGRAWEPMINRRGAAPAFLSTFARDASYTATLPVRGLHAIVIEDVFWSPRYRAGCGAAPGIRDHVMRELDTRLAQTPGPVWVLFHIPPGVDAFSTAKLAHRLAIVPFLLPDMRDGLLSLLGRTPGHVALAVAGHTHKFAYRIVDANGPHPVPMLLVPSISPIFFNAPSFLTANVDADGTLHDVEETSYLHNRWQRIGGLRDLGVDAFTGKQLLELQARLDRDPKVRATFDRLYGGGAVSEINDRTWPVYSCAATAFTSAAFNACYGAGGFSLITKRGLKFVVAVAIVVLLVVAGVAGLMYRRRRLVRP
jgi:sphingomyelin phosphodiesterase acid-like 3